MERPSVADGPDPKRVTRPVIGVSPQSCLGCAIWQSLAYMETPSIRFRSRTHMTYTQLGARSIDLFLWISERRRNKPCVNTHEIYYLHERWLLLM
jgi:hypothetical protein